MRYFITEPVNGGYQFFDVRDSEDTYMPNKSLVSIWNKLPGVDSKSLAENLCAIFNSTIRV